jgi:hypothetical protein
MLQKLSILPIIINKDTRGNGFLSSLFVLK